MRVYRRLKEHEDGILSMTASGDIPAAVPHERESSLARSSALDGSRLALNFQMPVNLHQ